jgi:hypothetical protein
MQRSHQSGRTCCAQQQRPFEVVVQVVAMQMRQLALLWM